MATNGVDGQGKDLSLARLVASRLQWIAKNDIPPHLKEKATLAILDYLGAVSCGLQAPWARSVCQYAQSRKGASEAHAWGLQQNRSAETAAFVNATLAHSAIRDDMHLKSNSHIGSIVISAAFALAQRDGWTGEQLIRGIVGGYEAAALLGIAVQQSKGYNRHFRPSGIVGAFGSAGAAIAATNADEKTAINSLNFAANMASGFNEWAWAGGTEIYAEMGTASQAGIVAFDLASAGMDCSETVLEGRAGLFAALSASEGLALFRQRLQTDIGQGIMDVNFKPVPGCNYAQTPLAVALRLSQKEKISDIQKVEVTCTGGAKNYPGCDNPGPFTTVQQTKMSIQFGVCAVLLNGVVSEELFQKFGDKTIETLAFSCIVQTSAEFDKSFGEGRQPARIEVTLGDGRKLAEELPDVPWVDPDGVVARFHAEMKGQFENEKSTKRLLETIQGLDKLKNLSGVWEVFQEATPLSG